MTKQEREALRDSTNLLAAMQRLLRQGAPIKSGTYLVVDRKTCYLAIAERVKANGKLLEASEQ